MKKYSLAKKKFGKIGSWKSILIKLGFLLSLPHKGKPPTTFSTINCFSFSCGGTEDRKAIVRTLKNLPCHLLLIITVLLVPFLLQGSI